MDKGLSDETYYTFTGIKEVKLDKNGLHIHLQNESKVLIAPQEITKVINVQPKN